MVISQTSRWVASVAGFIVGFFMIGPFLGLLGAALIYWLLLQPFTQRKPAWQSTIIVLVGVLFVEFIFLLALGRAVQSSM